MISLRTSAQGNFHANTILPPLGHPREQFQVGGIKFLSRFENRITGKFRERLSFVYLFIFLSVERSK